MNSEPINENMLSELSISNSERLSNKEQTERQKNLFAEELKRSIGGEIKTVLEEKKNEETNPKKKNKIKLFFEKIAKICW